MAKGTTYDREKVLYLAEKGNFNVDVNESQNRSKHVKGGNFAMTTLEKLVPQLVADKLLVKAAGDDGDKYYIITKLGEIELLRLQIKYRKSKGKDYKDLEDRREFMLESVNQFEQ